MAKPAVFARRMSRYAVNIEANTEKGVRKVVLAIDNSLVSTTPVDTGRARSNWIPNFNQPSEDIVGPSPAPSAKTAALVAGYDIDRHLAVHLTNNLPYIAELNRGSSQQQPAGFVRRAILAGTNAVKSVKLLKR